MKKRLLIGAVVIIALFSIGWSNGAWDEIRKLLSQDNTWTGDQTFFGAVAMATSASGLIVVSDADGVVLTSADWGKTIWMTGAGEVALPNAGASDIGKYIIVIVRDASEAVEVVLTDATELFVTTTGTALTAGNEANMGTTALSKTTFVYMETGKWYAFGSPVTDGGAAD